MADENRDFRAMKGKTIEFVEVGQDAGTVLFFCTDGTVFALSANQSEGLPYIAAIELDRSTRPSAGQAR